ncbi:hypothetical protein [Reyranella sp.]|uniref:hypothetical protein n=1 Tax=Reyranella sp. TaxID=1929291 RepID=UPI002730F2DF|nr:hypothetical protein [Reyranella sp.]MDP2378365.1 hypothetical protein [Reyranella sp.]
MADRRRSSRLMVPKMPRFWPEMNIDLDHFSCRFQAGPDETASRESASHPIHGDAHAEALQADVAAAKEVAEGLYASLAAEWAEFELSFQNYLPTDWRVR